ncbi:MAG: class I tRNA ligase family protein, partial [Treponema sp.]|nr:class I tRNA ligase family protein [Treponema sp.]
DWYVEATKLSFKNGDEHEKDRVVSVILNLLEENLRLLHPYLPFVTEEIYAKLPLAELVENRKKALKQVQGDGANGHPELVSGSIITTSEYNGMIINAPFPEPSDARKNDAVTKRFDVLKDLVGKVRALRVECGIDPALKINIAIKIEKGSDAEVCIAYADMVKLLSGIAKIDFVDAKPASSIGTVGVGFEAFILLDESINKEQLLTRFQKTLEEHKKYAERSQNKLNGNFAQHAPKEQVEAEKAKLAEELNVVEKMEVYIKELQ